MLERLKQLENAFNLSDGYKSVVKNGGTVSSEALALIAVVEEYVTLSKIITEQQQTILEMTMNTSPESMRTPPEPMSLAFGASFDFDSKKDEVPKAKVFTLVQGRIAD